MEAFVTEFDSEYSEKYSEPSFWGKLQDFALSAGKEMIELVLQLYYTLQNPMTPLWAKTVIIGSLGYFISPVDAIPDVTPLVGFSDDLGVLTMAIATVSTYINDDVRVKAANKLDELFSKR
jgi:uncharacterized membrane protein YkvA (DUF1232 family)